MRIKKLLCMLLTLTLLFSGNVYADEGIGNQVQLLQIPVMWNYGIPIFQV